MAQANYVLTSNDVIAKMGHGQPLRVPHDGSGPHLAAFRAEHEALPVPAHVVDILLRSNQIQKLTQFRNGQRCGWHELGWDGFNADYYVLMQ
jgi:hypothetical protein